MTFTSAGKEYTKYNSAIPAPLFRRSFMLTQEKDGAFIKIAALGFYKLYVNGKDITKGLLAPYISNPYHINYFDTYDVTEYMREGENVICALLANGFRNDEGGQIWDFDVAMFRGVPALALEFECGEVKFTAEDMMWKRSAILYDDYRCGVVFDARLWHEQELLPGASLVECEWRRPTPIEGEPLGELRECKAEPIRVYGAVAPKEIIAGSRVIYTPRRDVLRCEYCLSDEDFGEGYLYDFGINTAGTARLRIKGERGQKVSLRFGELRKDDDLDLRNINFQPEPFVQRCVYILSGDEYEEFEIPFTYYGYRYCHVYGISAEQATDDLLTMLPASSDIGVITSFECGNETVNKLFGMIKNSDLSNFYYFPNDCPQREKNGWTGDASESAERMMLLYGAEKSFDQWYDSIIMAQDERGALPGIVPTGGWGFAWGNGPAWDRAIVNLPYFVYKYTGKTDMVSRGATAIMRYLKYVNSRRMPDGTIEIGLGDYCQTGCGADKPTTPINFTDTVVAKDIADKAAFLLSLIGYDEKEIAYARTLSESLRACARAKFLSADDMSLAGGTQTAQGFGLEYGIFDDSERAAAAARLVREIENNNGHMNFGFLGSRVVFHALSNNGYSDVAYATMMRKTRPSYAHIVSQGYTSMPERFSTDSQVITHCSFNHHFHSDVGQWFIRNILGLNVNPLVCDPDTVMIIPCPVSEISYARGERLMPGGRVSVSWERNGDALEISVKTEGDVKVEFDPALKVTKTDNGRYTAKA